MVGIISLSIYHKLLDDCHIHSNYYQVYQKALFKMHGICNLRVNIHRLTTKKIVALTTGKTKLSAKTNLNSVRFHVSWLPTVSNTNPSAINAKKVAGKRGSRIQSLHEKSTNDITCNAAKDGEYLHDVSTSAPHKGTF